MNQTLTHPSLTSIERLVTSRHTVLEKIAQAQQLLSEAKQELASLGLTPRFALTQQHREICQASSHDELARAMNIDRDVWMLLHQRVMSQVQTSNQAQAYIDALYKGDYPPVSARSLMETLASFHEGAEDAYIQSVYDFWRSLHHQYTSNTRAKFGAKQVLTHACERSGVEGQSMLTRRVISRLEDLVKIIEMYQAQGQDFELRDVPEAWFFRRYPRGQWIDFGAFKFKLFKNENVHLMMSDALLEALNKTLATAAGRRLHQTR